MVRRPEAGQALAEFALVLPAATLLILGCLQAGLLGYASLVAREAAFRGVRAASVAGRADRSSAARMAATVAVAAAPGLTLAGVSVREPRTRFPQSGKEVKRLELVVRVGAPRLLPLRMSWIAEGRAVLPMEPAW